ncbi:MAG: nuclear transport factor 2 family protein [Proteobacteria bacterium]|nr:nuclear transport factor 2 family protein [Pseudomonadota bacterium]
MASPTNPSINPLAFLLLIVLQIPTSLAADGLTPMFDRLAIADALAQYSYRWDSKDSAGFANLFTNDGEMARWQEGALVENSRVIGKQAIFEYAKRSHEGRLADRQTRHHFSGLVFLELSEEMAVTENMALITHQRAEDSAAFISASGIYRNSWRKTADGWRISKRILFSDSFTGN